MRHTSGPIAFVTACLVASLARADESPYDIVDRSIKARSEKPELLLKLKTHVVAMEGKIFAEGMEIPAMREFQVDGLSQTRWVTEMMTPDGKKNRIVMVLQGNRGWMQIASMAPEEMSLNSIDEFKMEVYGRWLAMLTPLKDKAISLAALSDSTVGDEPVAVVKATARFRQDVFLSFSKKSGHLLKVAYKAREREVDVRKEHLFSDYKAFDGIQLPTKQIDMRELDKQAKHKAAEWTVKDYKIVEKFAAETFEKPTEKK